MGTEVPNTGDAIPATTYAVQGAAAANRRAILAALAEQDAGQYGLPMLPGPPCVWRPRHERDRQDAGILVLAGYAARAPRGDGAYLHITPAGWAAMKSSSKAARRRLAASAHRRRV